MRRLKEGDVVKCDIEWNLVVAKMIGVVYYDEHRYAYCVRGIVMPNTDEHERRFPVHECANIKLLREEDSDDV